jgi:hypothetical protein
MSWTDICLKRVPSDLHTMICEFPVDVAREESEVSNQQNAPTTLHTPTLIHATRPNHDQGPYRVALQTVEPGKEIVLGFWNFTHVEEGPFGR